jgi:hypothetical protein
MKRNGIVFTIFAGAFALSGCASEGGLDLLTTGSLAQQEPEQTKVAKARIDPVCIELMTRIDAIRKDGLPERIEKVGAGKTKTANVKRASLAKMAELDKANAEFQAKCSTLAPQQAKATTDPVKSAAAAANTAAQGAAQAAAKAAEVKQAAETAKAETQTAKTAIKTATN